MKVSIRFVNRGLSPARFNVLAFTQADAKKHVQGLSKSLEPLLDLRDEEMCEPGARRSFEFAWPSTWSVSPREVLWRAHPSVACLFELESMTVDGLEMLKNPGLLQ